MEEGQGRSLEALKQERYCFENRATPRMKYNFIVLQALKV
jgi:hypothetical protein